MNLRKKLIGDKAFYKMVLAVAVPMILQNGITNFVGLLDNIMVGQIGTEQMSGVAVANQLMFVFNLTIFGAISGAGIYGAQYYGSGNYEGVRHAFRFKLIISGVLLAVGSALFISRGDSLIIQYLNDEEQSGNVMLTLQYGHSYLMWMIAGLLPFVLTQVYAGTLKESGETLLPMKAGIAAMLVNLVLNYILIYGKLGIPALGVVGAAAATVISRYVECIIVVAWSHHHSKDKVPYMEGLYKTLRIPLRLAGEIFVRGLPLTVNESAWAAGMALMMQCYSMRGLDVIAGLNISSTISNLFGVVFISMGNVVAIIVGQLLGAGKMDEAKDTDTKLIFCSVASCFFIGTVMALAAPFFPRLYNTTDQVRLLAEKFIIITAMLMPMQAFMHTCYFTLRSGGKTFITFLFDSVFLWAVSIPLAFVLSRYTNLPIIPLYISCQLVDLIKCVIGFLMVKKGIWIHNFVADGAEGEKA